MAENIKKIADEYGLSIKLVRSLVKNGQLGSYLDYLKQMAEESKGRINPQSMSTGGYVTPKKKYGIVLSLIHI